MASVRYRKRGDSNLWTYEIRNEGKTVFVEFPRDIWEHIVTF